MERVPDTLLKSTLKPGRFVSAFRTTPRLVARIITHLHGSYEVLNLCHVSKEMTKIFETLFETNDEVRDAYLRRVIPDYRPAAWPNPSWLNKSIKIDLMDMELLLESASVLLSVYPMHALRVVAPQSHSSMSSIDTAERENTTSRFQTLTLTHSRFVAYLRQRTTSQALQIASTDEDDSILSLLDSPDDGPALVFPTPLFYFNDVAQPIVPAYLPLPTTKETTSHTKARSVTGTSKEKASIRLSKSKSASNISSDARNAADLGSVSKARKRLSLKPGRKDVVAPPPPPAMPALPNIAAANMSNQGLGQFGVIPPFAGQSMSLPHHSRSPSQNSALLPPLPQPSFAYTPPPTGHYSPPPTGHYTPPGSSQGYTPPPTIGYGTGGRSTPPMTMHTRRRNRRSAHMITDSPTIAASPANRSTALLSSTALSPSTTGLLSAATNGYEQPSPMSHDIHSLSLAFRQSRAPIFRVFVPCSQITPRILQECMKQLHAASLVPHLRAGDLVCNLGYVPDTSDDASNGGAAEGESGDCRGWMVSDGVGLHPLSTKHAIPVRDPTFVLTSPHYYSHVLLAGENPRFCMAIPLLPEPRSPPVWNLLRVTSSVAASTKKSAGGAESPKKHKVVRFIWVVRVECARWGQEWFIEVEGTKEGREYLEHVLMQTRNGIEHEWELVREKTGKGTVYIRKP